MSASHSTTTPIADLKRVLQRVGFLARERAVDDTLDSETWTALYEFAESHGLDWSLDSFEAEDGKVPPRVVSTLLDPNTPASAAPTTEQDDDLVVENDDDGGDAPTDLSAVEIFDLTTQHELNPHKCKRTHRELADITTIVLHQTGVKFGATKHDIAKYGQRVAVHRRFFDVACHVAALMNGDVLYVNPWPRYVLHGHSSNAYSIGVEIEGLYAGVLGDAKTVSGKATANTLTPRTIAAARRAVQYAVQECRKLGCPITKLAAHRNFHGSRISDPGQEIWHEVGLWAAKQLELTIDYDLAVVSKTDARLNGLKIPREWDPAGKVDYRGHSPG